MAEAFASSTLQLSFKRQLTGVCLEEWHALQCRFQHFTLSDRLEDRLIWRWSKDDNFTVHSFYQWLEYGGIPNKEYNSIWKSHIPLKIKIFLWLVRRDKILTKINLVAKGWQGDISCVFCGQPGDTEHLFIHCSYIRLIWHWIADHNNFTFTCASLEDMGIRCIYSFKR